MDIIVKREHPLTKDRFPLGFKTTLTKVYSKEDKLVKGFTRYDYKVVVVKDRLERESYPVKIEDKTISKGTYIDSIIIDIDGNEVTSDWFYRNTGRSFSEFFDK
jgi:hypothetical protein